MTKMKPLHREVEQVTRTRRKWLAIGICVAAVGAASAYFLMRPPSTVVREEAYLIPAATESQLEQSANLRVFFGHQSVGANLLDAVPAVYASTGLSAPEIFVSEKPQVSSGGYLQHTFIGRNGDPLGKIAEFDRIMRGGVANEVDAAALKLCYADFHSGDDTKTVFDAYRSTLAALQRDYPDVTFVYMTTPLTTEQGIKSWVKGRLGLNAPHGPEHNVAREDFNAMIRAEFADTGRLFDVAAIQSTAPDGSRQVRNYSGTDYYAMEEELSKDAGHLNSAGSAIAASAFLHTLASVTSSDNQ